MPVTLYHGPAGAEKRDRLKSVAAELLRGGEEFLFVTGNDALATRLKTELTSLSPGRLLMGSRVTTFTELFLKLVKLSRHRAHVADKDFRLALLLVTARDIFPAAVSNPEALGRRLEQWLGFFDALKSCGVGPEGAKRLLTEHVEDERLFDVFAAFQKRLAALNDYDPSGLALAVLEDLRGGRLKWFPGVKRIVIADAYPLHAGHREFLRLMKKRRPDVAFDVFYDEDFARADDLLATAYEELGELSDVSEHIEGSQSPLTVRVFPSPEEEAFSIAKEARSLIDSGVPAHGIAIAIPPSHAFLFETSLARHGVPHSTHLPLKVRDYLPKDFFRNAARDKTVARLVVLARRGNPAAIRRLQAVTAWERHEDGLEFLNALFGTELRRLPGALERALTDHLAARLTFVPAREAHDAVLTNFSGAASFFDRHVFLTGLCAENVPVRGEDAAYAPSLKTKREFAELLRFPGYEYRVRLEKIRQVIQSAGAARLSRPASDVSGRSVTRLPFERPVFRELHAATEPKRFSSAASREFPAHAPEKFPITGIEAYLSCPYKYYAAKVLDLGSPERDGIEPGGDVRGSFLHLVLQKLVDERREDYVSALKDAARLSEFLEAVQIFVRKTAGNFPDFVEFEPAIVENETTRATRAIVNLIRMEAEQFRKGAKVTLPAHVEWPLSHARESGFTLQTAAGPVTLTGRIDRVDHSAEAECFSVIDYKTGEMPSTKDLNEARSVQITLYLMAVGELLYPGSKPSGAFFYGLKKRKIGGGALKASPDEKFVRTRFKPTPAEWDALQGRVRAAVGAAVTGIRGGRFGADPADPSQCGFCDYRRICGHRPGDGDDGSES